MAFHKMEKMLSDGQINPNNLPGLMEIPVKSERGGGVETLHFQRKKIRLPRVDGEIESLNYYDPRNGKEYYLVFQGGSILIYLDEGKPEITEVGKYTR